MATGKPLPVWKRLTGTISASSTEDVATLPSASFNGAKFEINVAGNSKIKNFTMDCSLKNGQPVSSVDSRIGDDLEVSLKFELSGSDVVFRIENQEAFSVAFSVFQFKH